MRMRFLMKKTKQSPTSTDFDIIYATLNSKGNIYFNKFISRATSINEAIMVHWFLWMWREKSKNGEMFIVENTFIEYTCVPKCAFPKIVKKWEGLGLIKTELKGAPMKKYYQLKESKFATYVDTLLRQRNVCLVNQSKSDWLTRQKVTGYSNTNTHYVRTSLKENKKTNNRSAAKKRRSDGEKTLGLPNSKNKTPDISKKYKSADKVAKKLQHVLAHHNWINFTPKLDVWTKEIIKLHDADLHPVKFKDMRLAIQWLKDHGNELYCPVPRDAKQFVEKYPTIMRQINKNKLETNNTEDEIDYDKPNSTNLCSKGYSCQSYHRNHINVYKIILPGSICDISNLCRKCFKKKINEGL